MTDNEAIGNNADETETTSSSTSSAIDGDANGGGSGSGNPSSESSSSSRGSSSSSKMAALLQGVKGDGSSSSGDRRSGDSVNSGDCGGRLADMISRILQQPVQGFFLPTREWYSVEVETGKQDSDDE